MIVALEMLKLFGRRLNLDEEWLSQQEFERIEDTEIGIGRKQGYAKVGAETCIAWFAPLMKIALESGAQAIHLLKDREGNCLRQLLFCPKEPGSSKINWTELVPLPEIMQKPGFQAIRMLARMAPWSNRGKIPFSYRNQKRSAICIQQSAYDLIVYFSELRPPHRRLCDNDCEPE